MFEVLKEGAPYRHFNRAMRREARTKAEDAGDIVVRKFAIVPFGEGGKVRYPIAEIGSSGALSFAIRAMASGAKLFIHRFTGGNIRGWELRFVRIVRQRRVGNF